MQKRGQKKEKTFWRRILYSQLVIVVGIGFIVMFSIGISKRMVRQHQLDKEVSGLNREIARLEKSNQEFNRLLTYLNSNDFLEEEARMKLGLKKEGEQVAIINDKLKTEKPKKEIQTKIYQPAQPRQKGNSEKWWFYFFSITRSE